MDRNPILRRIACLLTLILAGTASAEMFLKFDDINGDSLHPDYPGWSDLSNLNLTIDHPPGSIATLEAARLSLPVDSAYPLFLRKLVQGERTDRVDIEILDDGLRTVAYEFNDVTIESLSVNHGSTGTGGLVMFVDMRRIEATFTRYDSNGNPAGNTQTVWNFGTGSPGGQVLAGDYDNDGDVDFADYDVWRDEFGAIMVNIGTGSDGNSDGIVDAADYTVWRDGYIAYQAIPEPHLWHLAPWGGLVFLRHRARAVLTGRNHA